MNKYCPICEVENLEDARFCKNCGAKFEVQIPTYNKSPQTSSNVNMIPHYYGQTQQYTPQKPSRNLKPIIAVVAIVGVVAILIGALLSTGIITGGINNDQDVIKIPVEGGPKVNLQSIANGGNTMMQPAEDHTATYGYYMSGNKFGDVSFTNQGEEYYQGEQCKKITGSGNFDIEIYGQSMEINFDINGYISKSDETLVYCNYDFSVVKPISFDMDATINVDKDNDEITYTFDNGMTGITSTVIQVSDDYWTKTNLDDNLYVGYSTEVSYTVNVYGYDTESNMKMSVTGQEDITVKKGSFEDCYIVQVEQDGTETAKIWIDEDGVCPKIQIGSGVTSMGIGDFTIELEDYYTT